MAWAAGLQVRKRRRRRSGAFDFDWLEEFSLQTLLSQPLPLPSPLDSPLFNHQKIHIWHLQSQPEFRARFPDVRDPEETEKS